MTAELQWYGVNYLFRVEYLRDRRRRRRRIASASKMVRPRKQSNDLAHALLNGSDYFPNTM